MKTQPSLQKKRNFNKLGIILGAGGLILPVYLAVVFYNRGIYVDEHNLGGYITAGEVVLMAATPVLLVASVLCFKAAQSKR